jgi:hypothetical protein
MGVFDNFSWKMMNELCTLDLLLLPYSFSLEMVG